jgi:hypothetical protein
MKNEKLKTKVVHFVQFPFLILRFAFFIFNFHLINLHHCAFYFGDAAGFGF